jgi:hypothetical protein
MIHASSSKAQVRNNQLSTNLNKVNQQNVNHTMKKNPSQKIGMSELGKFESSIMMIWIFIFNLLKTICFQISEFLTHSIDELMDKSNKLKMQLQKEALISSNDSGVGGVYKKPRQPKQRVGVSSKVSSSEKEKINSKDIVKGKNVY